MKELIKNMIKTNYLFNEVTAYIYNIFGIKYKIIRGKKNYIIYKKAYLRRMKIKISGNQNVVTIHPKAKLTNCSINITGKNCKVNIGESCILNNVTLALSQDCSKISFGKNCTMNGGLIYAGESKSITIGEDCMFSSKIDVRTTDSHSVISSVTSLRINKAKDIIIGDHIWIGNSVKILKGTIIENNSIIGANAVVSGIVKENCMAVGIPAKVIKTEVTWNRELIVQ